MENTSRVGVLLDSTNSELPLVYTGEDSPDDMLCGVTSISSLIRILPASRNVYNILKEDPGEEAAQVAARYLDSYRSIVANNITKGLRRELDEFAPDTETQTSGTVKVQYAQFLGWLEGVLQGVEGSLALSRMHQRVMPPVEPVEIPAEEEHGNYL